MRSCSGLQASFDTGSIPLWLILTGFQLTRQSFNFNLYTNNSLHQTISEIRWRITNRPRSGHLRFMLVCKLMEMMLQPVWILNNLGATLCMDSQIVPCGDDPACLSLGRVP